MKKILLDAGHGGSDPGAVSSSGLKEKDINLKLAFKIEQRLNLRGVLTSQTRTTDILLGQNINSDLQNRVNMANNEIKPDFFVSIHNNALYTTSKGTETFVIARGGQAEKLAESVQKSLVNAIKSVDRGVKVGNFYVLRETKMPAILVEGLFLSNPHEAAQLADDLFLDKMADGIAKGICDFLGIKWEIAYSKSWEWGLSKGVVLERHKTLEVEKAVELLYNLDRTPLRPSVYEKVGITHVVRVDPMALKARDMVLKSGRVLSATLKNFINGNFINYKSDGTIDKTIGWLISEGIVFSDRYEHLKWVGNPKGTIIVFKNGKVEIGWKWDSEMARTKDDIWFCCQGFNLYPPDMTVSQGIAREGFQYASVGYTTDRLAMGYDGKNIVITARPESNAERAVLTMDNLGCKGNAICLDSGGSTNLVHDGKKHIVTDRTLASIIEW